MVNGNRLIRILWIGLLLAGILTGCQLSSTPTVLPPSHTPTTAPTITPTPGPQTMDMDTLRQNCEALDQQNATIVLSGKVFLPDETIYGYKGWYGMDLISGSRLTVLFAIGSGPNTMQELPQYFHEQDLLIHASDNRVVRHGHEVRVIGHPKYRTDSEIRSCELFVDQVESLTPADVLLPKDLTIEELINDNEIDDCDYLEFNRQMVRLRGELRVDNYLSGCQLGVCKILLKDTTGSLTAKVLEGESANHMATLPDLFTIQDLKVLDKNGEPVTNWTSALIGVVHMSDSSACEMIVYEVENGE